MPHMGGRREGNALVFDLAVGEIRSGLWCPHCLLPSGLEVELHSMCAEHGSHRFGTLRICDDCKATLRKDGSDG